MCEMADLVFLEEVVGGAGLVLVEDVVGGWSRVRWCGGGLV